MSILDISIKSSDNNIAYMPIQKNRHWNKRLINPFVLYLIPKYPEIKTKVFTAPTHNACEKLRKIDWMGNSLASTVVNAPVEK